MKINEKHMRKRKVKHLKYKKDNFILGIVSETDLNIKNPCKINNEIKRYKLSEITPNIGDRILPRCFRHKCKKMCFKQTHTHRMLEEKKVSS